MTTSSTRRRQRAGAHNNQQMGVYLSILQLAVTVATFVVSLAMLLVMLLPR